jgi:hypothetical protein
VTFATAGAPGIEVYRRLTGDRGRRLYLSAGAGRSLPTVGDTIGVGPAAVHRMRVTSRREGGAGPDGLPDPDGYVPGTEHHRHPTPWWWERTIRLWAVETGQLTVAGEPLRHHHTTHPAPRPQIVLDAALVERHRALTGDRGARWYLPDVARELGFPVDTVKRRWRDRGLVEGGCGPVGFPDPDGYHAGVNQAARPWWWPGTVWRWAVETGRASPAGIRVRAA